MWRALLLVLLPCLPSITDLYADAVPGLASSERAALDWVAQISRTNPGRLACVR